MESKKGTGSSSRFHPLLLLVVWLGLAGAAASWIVPPFQLPDEAGHWMAGLSRIQAALGGSRGGDGPLCSPEMALVEHYGEIPPFRRNPVPAVLAPACRNYVITYGGLASYPQLWVATAASRMFDVHPETAFRLARLAGGVWVLAAALLAAGLSRRHGAPVAFGVTAWSLVLLLSPIGIQQAFAVSLDGGVLAFSVWMAAFFGTASVWRSRDWILFAIFGLVALQSKPVLAPVLLSFFWVPEFRRATGLGRKLGSLVIALLCLYGIGSGLATRATQVNGPSGNSGAQMAHIFSHPLESAALIGWTTLKKAVIPTQWMLARLGWFDHVASHPALATTLASLLVLLLSGIQWSSLRLPALRDWIFGALWLGSASLVTLFMYLVWTPPGSGFVIGLQGRYFVPYLILLGGYALARLESAVSEKALLWIVGIQGASAVLSVLDAIRFYGLR